MPSPAPRKKQHPSRSTPPTPEVVDPRWLLKAGAITVLVAMVCGYLTICWIFYQGQWQLILHPKQTTSAPSKIAGVPCRLLHFAPDDSGMPQLTAWSIPAEADAPYHPYTVLFLPPGDGSLADSAAKLAALHNLGLNIFAIDYRGYGQSAKVRPNEARMTQDADSAWGYLTNLGKVQGSDVVLYGAGLGASLATHLAQEHPESQALILEAPVRTPLSIVRADPRTRLLPLSLLFHEHFPLEGPLSSLKTPKLLFSSSGENPAFQNAASPKITVELPHGQSELYAQSIRRFLDQYLVRRPASLAPSSSGS